MPGTPEFALLVLFLTLLATLWGGILAGPDRWVPFLFVAGTLLLPSAGSFPLPLVPDLTRHSAIAIPAAVLLLFTPAWRWRAMRFALPDAVFLAYATWHAIAVLANQGGWAALSGFVYAALTIGMPYLAGRLWLNRGDDVVALARSLLPIALLVLLGAIYELRMAPVLHDTLYGDSPAIPLTRYGIWRPRVFAESTLELGHHLAILAVAVFAVLRARRALHGERSLWLAATFATLALATCLCLSRGPVIGMMLGLLLPYVLRNTGAFAAGIGLLGLAFFVWMIGPWSSGVQGARLLLDDVSHQDAYNIYYRFLQIDVFQPMVEAQPLFGYGETWERTGPIVVIDGAFLLHILANGYPGLLLIGSFWVLLAWSAGRTWPRRSEVDWLGVHVAPVIGWLTFSAWGDAFMGVPQHVLAGAAVGAATLRRAADGAQRAGDGGDDGRAPEDPIAGGPALHRVRMRTG